MKPTITLDTTEFNWAIGELAEMPVMIENIVAEFKDKARKKLSENDFSITEHICHLRDLESEGYAPRINKILTEIKPFLSDFKGGEIALQRDYNSQNEITALKDLTIARRQNVEILKSTEPEQLERSGELEGVGQITLRDLIKLMLRHDKEHLKELKALTKQL